MLLACSGSHGRTYPGVERDQKVVVKDVHAIWELPVIVLLPLVYALFMPIARLGLAQWRVGRAPVYRRVFSAAAIGIAYGSASLAFRGLRAWPRFKSGS